MKDSIRLSRKHGVNPSVMQCFFCGESCGVVLFGVLPGDQEAPRQAVLDREPCSKCQGYMAQGVMLVQVRDNETGDNPYRTGHLAVVTEDAIRRMLNIGLADEIVRTRFAFVPQTVWQQLGLPEGAGGG